MVKHIYFVRHGSVTNPQAIWYGRMEGYALSEVGIKQVQQTATFLKTQKIDALYSSPLLRAQQTAEILQATLLVPIQYTDLLLEVDSSLQGKTYTYLKSIDYDIFVSGTNDVVGETVEQIRERMMKFVRSANGDNIVAVSHGDPLMIVRMIKESMPMDNNHLRSFSDYIQPGEVYRAVIKNDQLIDITSVFQPSI